MAKKPVTARLPEEIVERIDEASENRAEFVREAVDEKLGSEGNPGPAEDVPDIGNLTSGEILDALGIDYKIEGPLGLPIPRAKLILGRKESEE